VSSRQSEKERRRQDRLAHERAAAAAAARRKRLQLVFGALLGVALIAGTVVLVVVGIRGSSSSGSRTAAANGVKLPPPRVSDLPTAAKAAGCVLQNPPDQGRLHLAKDFKPSDYGSNPPTSGPHNPDYYQDGIYSPGDTPRLGMLVHPLEHGRIEIQYKPGTAKRVEAQLETLLGEQDGGYHMLLFQNTTGMRYQVAAAAWDHLIGCPRMNDRVFDALRDFRTAYIDKGPEKVP
jgi:hypothetical protein